MTITFEGLPRGIAAQTGVYSEGGMQLGMAYGPGSVYLSGGGIPGYPDNGTGYLSIADGGATRLEFGFNAFPPGSVVPFNLVSFDAAEYGGLGAQSLIVVGYKPQMMAPPATVTNVFTLDGINDGTGPLQDFQTFSLDSSFQGIFKVDVFNARWSLDNLVISGVPEPSTVGLALVAVMFALGHRGRVRGR